MKKVCKVCGKEYSVSEKNLPYDKELCSMQCEAKFLKMSFAKKTDSGKKRLHLRSVRRGGGTWKNSVKTGGDTRKTSTGAF